MSRKTVWLALLLSAGCGAGHECFVNVSGQVTSSDLCSVATDTTNHFLIAANDGFLADVVMTAVAPGTYSSTDAGAKGACRMQADTGDLFLEGGIYEVTTKDPASGSFKLVIASVEDRTPPPGPDGVATPSRTVVHGSLDCDARARDQSTGSVNVHATGSVHVHAAF
jgi:hypothetical protein